MAGAQLPPPDLLLAEPRPAIILLGPMDVHLRANTLFMYDDNISLHEQSRPQYGIFTGTDQPPVGDDYIVSISPGIRLTKSASTEVSPSSLNLDYSPSFIFFLRNDTLNSVDHSARMDAGYGFTKLSLTLLQSYEDTSGGVIDVGARVNQKNYRTGGSARYEMSEKTFFLLDGAYRLTDFETQTDSEEWNTSATAHYQVSPKVTLGLGLSYGRLTVSEQSTVTTTAATTNAITSEITTTTNSHVQVTPRTQSYLGPTLRAAYKTTEKTSLELSAGADWRSYEDGSSSFSPVFALTASYRPNDGTALAVEAHRREQNSAVVNGANFIATGVSLSLRQRLLERLSGTLSLSYDNSEYIPARRTVETSRNDDYFLLRYGLEATIGRSWTLSIFHQFRDNNSTDPGFSFENNQVGIQAAWQL